MTAAVPKSLLAVPLALALALAPAATAAPAGDEYLPQEPTAAGGQQSGDGSGAGAPSGAAEAKGKAGQSGKGNGPQGTEGSAAPASSSDEGSSGALAILTDPIVLLLIAGVVIAAIGMTLRHREGDQGAGSQPAERNPGAAPPTPEGEIVTGERHS